MVANEGPLFKRSRVHEVRNIRHVDGDLYDAQPLERRPSVRDLVRNFLTVAPIKTNYFYEPIAKRTPSN